MAWERYTHTGGDESPRLLTIRFCVLWIPRPSVTIYHLSVLSASDFSPFSHRQPLLLFPAIDVPRIPLAPALLRGGSDGEALGLKLVDACPKPHAAVQPVALQGAYAAVRDEVLPDVLTLGHGWPL